MLPVSKEMSESASGQEQRNLRLLLLHSLRLIQHWAPSALLQVGTHSSEHPGLAGSASAEPVGCH